MITNYDLVHGKNEEEYEKRLIKVMEKLRENNLIINMMKIQYKQRKVRILGVEIDGEKQINKY